MYDSYEVMHTSLKGPIGVLCVLNSGDQIWGEIPFALRAVGICMDVQ